jgi:hypothetical protein
VEGCFLPDEDVARTTELPTRMKPCSYPTLEELLQVAGRRKYFAGTESGGQLGIGEER